MVLTNYVIYLCRLVLFDKRCVSLHIILIEVMFWQFIINRLINEVWYAALLVVGFMYICLMSVDVVCSHFINGFVIIMCIVLIKKSLNPDFSFFLGMNRDEKYTKQWDEISAHWKLYPHIFGYKDHDSGGTWFAYNKCLTAILINRETYNYHLLQSRSKIVLMALQNANSLDKAIENLSKEDTSFYKPFNLVLLNNKEIVLATNYYDNKLNYQVNVTHIEDDLVLINRSTPNDLNEKRIKLNIEKLRWLKEPNPKENKWDDWEQILTTECYAEGPEDENCLWLNSKEWGTLLSEIIAIPRKKNQIPVIHRVKTR